MISLYGGLSVCLDIEAIRIEPYRELYCLSLAYLKLILICVLLHVYRCRFAPGGAQISQKVYCLTVAFSRLPMRLVEDGP